jgi:hypothetical protein
MKEEAYRPVTHDLTMSVAGTLSRLNPALTLSMSRARIPIARSEVASCGPGVNGETENSLLQTPFKSTYMFRPGYIQPLCGIRTKTKWYGAVYAMLGPLYPVWKLLFPEIRDNDRVRRSCDVERR